MAAMNGVNPISNAFGTLLNNTSKAGNLNSRCIDEKGNLIMFGHEKCHGNNINVRESFRNYSSPQKPLVVSQ